MSLRGLLKLLKVSVAVANAEAVVMVVLGGRAVSGGVGAKGGLSVEAAPCTSERMSIGFSSKLIGWWLWKGRLEEGPPGPLIVLLEYSSLALLKELTTYRVARAVALCLRKLSVTWWAVQLDTLERGY